VPFENLVVGSLINISHHILVHRREMEALRRSPREGSHGVARRATTIDVVIRSMDFGPRLSPRITRITIRTLRLANIQGARFHKTYFFEQEDPQGCLIDGMREDGHARSLVAGKVGIKHKWREFSADTELNEKYSCLQRIS